jgi:glycosyltransferase involved in cell wall biosynthesis
VRAVRASIDCRYIRERPSGIGAYVRALADRVPALARDDRFDLWVDPRAKRPLTGFPNVTETLVRPAANSLPTLLWPSRLADLRAADVLHEPFNLLGRGVPCASVVTLHDLIWLLTPTASEGLSLATPFQALFYRDGIQRTLRLATRIVAISHATASAIHLVAPEASPRVRVVHHGVEARFAPPASDDAARATAARLLGTEDPYLLVVGQNAPFKNHEGILEGFAAADLGPNVRLVLLQRLYAGGRLLERARALGIADRVVFRSGLTEDEVVTLLQAALALVQFSRFEGFGMPALEAIACGTPVVASDIAPLVEVLGGAAVHARLDPRALGAALRRVVAEPLLRAELGARGLERARAFSWDRSAAEHLEVYRDAAREGPRR